MNAATIETMSGLMLESFNRLSEELRTEGNFEAAEKALIASEKLDTVSLAKLYVITRSI